MNEFHRCSIFVNWKEKKKGSISFGDEKKENIDFSVPPEFMGHQHMITPEDLFLGSIVTCLASYFFNMAERSRLKFTTFEACGKTSIKKNGIDYVFTDIKINVNIRVKNEKDQKKAKRAIEISERGCYIANSIKPEVNITTNILMTD